MDHLRDSINENHIHIKSHSREVAAISVTNVDLIEEFVFSAAFSTFDQVTFVKML